MKLNKELVDELIRLTKKFFRTGDIDLLDAYRKAEETLKYHKGCWRSTDLISDLARYAQYIGKGTYENIYKALAVFGIEVVKNEIS